MADFKCKSCGRKIGVVVGVVLYVPDETTCCLIVIEGRVRCPECFTARRFYKSKAVDSTKARVLDTQSDLRSR